MTYRDYLIRRVLALTGGVLPGGSPADVARLTFVSDEEAVKTAKIREYDVWYKGDSDELLNLYTKDNAIDFSTEPWYWRNKRSYFWSAASTEDDVKRTHSGQPANIVNTLVSIVGKPTFSVGGGEAPKSDITGEAAKRSEEASDKWAEEALREMLDEQDFWTTYKEVQLPMTLVEGWGCWKVSWDLSVSSHPYASYYRAENVDFVWRAGRLIGVVFRDWYVGKDEARRYLVTETRYLAGRKDPSGRTVRDLHIVTEAWSVGGGDMKGDTVLTKLDGLSEVPELAQAEQSIVIEDFDSLLARPCVLYKDATDPKAPGRSIFANKIDLFDDLDQCLSQSANTVAKSTPEELFNTDFLERDENNLPIQPKRYDRKYTMYAGARDANGGQNTTEPVQVTQPNLNLPQYDSTASSILSEILSGIMSPATMGIGVAVQSTAESQREKEKVTISTRNHIIDAESKILQGLFSDMLCVEQYLNKPVVGADGVEYHAITVRHYDVSVKFSEFADASFEEKATTLAGMLQNGAMSPEMYIDKLYGDSLSEGDRAFELDYIKQTMQAMQQQPGMDEGDPLSQMMAMGGGQPPEAPQQQPPRAPDPRGPQGEGPARDPMPDK